MRMLVPVDGSDNALRALDHALAVARLGPSVTIHLLHVYEDIPDGDRAHAFHSNQEMQRLGRERGEAVLQAAAEHAASSGAQVVTDLAAGETATAIVDRAEALGCDSIVMGMRGQSLLAHILLGSIVTSLLGKTKLPVTLVK